VDTFFDVPNCITKREKVTPAVRISFSSKRKYLKIQQAKIIQIVYAAKNAAIKIEKFFCIFAKKRIFKYQL